MLNYGGNREQPCINVHWSRGCLWYAKIDPTSDYRSFEFRGVATKCLFAKAPMGGDRGVVFLVFLGEGTFT